MRYELTDHEWAAIKSMLPNKPRGVARVAVFSTASFGCCGPARPGGTCRIGPYTTCYNRFVRWRRAGVWGKIMNALARPHDAAVQMIDTSIVRVHQHGACITRNRRQSMGRSRGGLTSKIHAVVDTNGLPVRLALTAGEAHDNRLAGSLFSHLKTGSMLLADRGYDADWIRALVKKRRAWANIPPRSNRNEPICSARISTEPQPGRTVLSIKSSNVGGSRRATTNSRQTFSPSFGSHPSGCGCALLGLRPGMSSQERADATVVSRRRAGGLPSAPHRLI
jgi:transposase